MHGDASIRRLLCNADCLPSLRGQWRVTVWGGVRDVSGPLPTTCPTDFTRTYAITAKSDSLAVREAMDRFREEFFPE